MRLSLRHWSAAFGSMVILVSFQNCGTEMSGFALDSTLEIGEFSSSLPEAIKPLDKQILCRNASDPSSQLSKAVYINPGQEVICEISRTSGIDFTFASRTYTAETRKYDREQPASSQDLVTSGEWKKVLKGQGQVSYTFQKQNNFQTNTMQTINIYEENSSEVIDFINIYFLTKISPITYYISDCQTGADPACVPGDDANDGLTPATPKRTINGILRASNTYRFARGGSWTNAHMTISLPASNKLHPTVFEDYVPSWGSGKAKPILKAGQTTSSNGPIGATLFNFWDSGNSTHDEGYIVRNLELRAFGDGKGNGVTVFNDADYVTLDNLTIDGFQLGVLLSRGNPPDPGADTNNSYFTLKNSTIKNSSGMGMLGSSHHMLIEKNTFDSNGSARAVYDHHLYFSGYGRNAIVRGNYFVNNNRMKGVGICSSVTIVAHGYLPDLLVENNTIYEPTSKGVCYGIDLNGSTGAKNDPIDYSRLVIRSNRIVLGGEAGLGIGCNSCPDAVIENNVIIKSGTAGFKGIMVPSAQANIARGDAIDTKVTVRNNSIYIDTPSTATAVKVGSSTGQGDSIVSNLISFGPSVTTRSSCFDVGTRPLSAFAAFDHNLCFRSAGPVTWSTQHANLATAQAAGFDLKSLSVDPQLMAKPANLESWFLDTLSTSPAVDAGHPTLSAPQGFGASPKKGLRDIGAWEH